MGRAGSCDAATSLGKERRRAWGRSGAALTPLPTGGGQRQQRRTTRRPEGDLGGAVTTSSWVLRRKKGRSGRLQTRALEGQQFGRGPCTASHLNQLCVQSVGLSALSELGPGTQVPVNKGARLICSVCTAAMLQRGSQDRYPPHPMPHVQKSKCSLWYVQRLRSFLVSSSGVRSKCHGTPIAMCSRPT